MNVPLPIAADLLALLRCPTCKGQLRLVESDGPMLECPACRVRYAIRDGIPVMLVDQAVPF